MKPLDIEQGDAPRTTRFGNKRGSATFVNEVRDLHAATKSQESREKEYENDPDDGRTAAEIAAAQVGIDLKR